MMFSFKRKQRRDDHARASCGVAQVRNLLPLRHLSDQEFERIASHATSQIHPPGHELFDVNHDGGWLSYLIEGVVEIRARDGTSYTVRSGTIEALYPLIPQAPARVSAVSVTAVRVVEFPAQVFELAPKPEVDPAVQASGITVDEDADEGLDKHILFDVYHDLMSGQLVLPTLPDVAMRIRAAIDDPDHDADKIARIVQADPSIAAYCVSVANNAAFAAAAPITEIRDAIVRMGMAAARDLVTAYAMRGLFKTDDRLCKALMRQVWQHSCRIGALSYVIARDLSRINPERAMLTGTLHDIGVLALINRAQAYPDLLASDTTLFALLGELRGQIGAMVLRAWKIPEALVNATLNADDWMRDEGPRADLCDIVLLAHAHERAVQPWSTKPPPVEDLPAFRKLEKNMLTAANPLAVLGRAKTELAALARLLHG